MTIPLLSTDAYTSRSTLPRSYVEDLEQSEPGWVDGQLTQHTGYIYSRLGKRYATPFVSPYPETAVLWLTQLTDLVVMIRRGANANDEMMRLITQGAELARQELKEAADAQNGLFELPLRDDVPGNGITRRAPLGYSEQSPYAGASLQRQFGMAEDYNV